MAKKKKDEVKEAVIVEENDNINQLNKNGYIIRRVIAYFIDALLVSVLCFGVLFIMPKNDNYRKYMKEYETIQVQYMEKEITKEEFFNKSIDIVYDIDYSNTISLIVQVIIIMLYFIVFQFYNKGQTFGKKLMKLRVVSTNSDELTMNQVAIRALIIDSILVNILIIGSLLFLGRDYYYYASLIFQRISMIISPIALIMVFYRKDGKGLHDVLAKTQVIQVEV